MRIAVLMSGQARHIERSAEFWRQRIMHSHLNQIKVDYFLHLWDNGDPNLKNYVKDLYQAKVVDISNYDDTVTEHIQNVKNGNDIATDWWLAPDYVQHTLCYRTDQMSQYTYNFPGMYLATAKIAKTFEPYVQDYDIVIKTRTDCVLNPMSERHMIQLYANMLRNPVFRDVIFTPWLRIRNGLPFFGDLAFVGKPNLMQNFMKDMDKSLVKLATKDKHLLSDYMIDPEIPFPHWLWSRLSMYSRTDWLAISVVWPVPFGTCLLRSDEPVLDKNFQYLEQTYNEHEKVKHAQIAHEIIKHH